MAFSPATSWLTDAPANYIHQKKGQQQAAILKSQSSHAYIKSLKDSITNVVAFQRDPVNLEDIHKLRNMQVPGGKRVVVTM